MDGTMLTARRDALGMSKAELGRRLNVAQNTIARWEKGEVTIQRPDMLDLALNALEREVAEERDAKAERTRPMHPMESRATPFVSLLRQGEEGGGD